MFLIFLGGLITAFTIKVEVFPEFSMDMITVTMEYPGASPAEVEESIIRRIEERVAGLAGIKRIDSSAREGFGSVNIEVIKDWDLKKLLDEAGLDYAHTKEGLFKIILTSKGRSALVVAEEVTLYADDKGNPVKLVYFWTEVVSVPDGFKHPANMLRRIAEINDKLRVGNVGITSQGGVFYNSSFWLSTANTQILQDELALAFFTIPDLRKDLLPFVKEE